MSFGLSQALTRLGVTNAIVYEDEIEKANSVTMLRALEPVEVYGEVGFLGPENANDSLPGAASDFLITVAGPNVVVSYSVRARLPACSNRIGEGRELP